MDISNKSLYMNITKFKEIEDELRKSIERQSFIIKLCDILRPLSDEKSILDSASSLLIKYLKVSEVYYSHYSEDKVIASKEIQDGDTILVPIYKNDHIVASLSIKNSRPRLWSIEEVELVRGVGQRIYAAVDRVRFEKVLEDSEAKYRKIFETSNDGFWWEDKYGYVTEANEGTAKMLGYNQEELIGRHWKNFIDDEWLHVVYKQWKDHKGQKPNRYEMKLKKKDGSSIWVKISIASLINEEGDYTGTLIAFNDITQGKKSEERLRKSEKKQLL